MTYSLQQVPGLLHTYLNGAAPAREETERTGGFAPNPMRVSDHMAEMLDMQRAWSSFEHEHPAATIVRMVCAEGRTVSEAARVCGLYPAQATAILNKGLHRLRFLLNFSTN